MKGWLFRVEAAIASFACVVACNVTPVHAPSEAPTRPFRVVPLGLCEDYPEESRSLEEARRDLGVLKAAGVSLLRVSIGWDGVEPQKDHYDFAFWDAFVDMAVGEFGVRLIPYVAYTPAWNSDGTPEASWKAPPRDMREFGEIMGLLASRYRGRIESWELWNEPDNADYWSGTPADYGRLLAEGSSAVRAADPRAQVVFGGLAGHIDFLRAAFDEERAGDHVDVVNLHAYYETWNPEPLETISGYVAAAAAVVHDHGGRQALWMAEVGYSNFRSPDDRSSVFAYEHTPDFQAVMLVRTLALLESNPLVSLIAWYELKDPRSSDRVIGDDHNRHLGLTFADYHPKPAFDALSFTNAVFSRGFRSIDGELTVTATPATDVVLRGFVTARGKVVIVAWLTTRGGANPAFMAVQDRRTARVRVSVPCVSRGQAIVYDARGRPGRGVVSTRRSAGKTELEFDVPDGDVQIVEVAIAGR